MAYARIPASPMNGGVSTQPQDSRLPEQTESSDNTSLFYQRGLEKRPGTTHIPGQGSSGGVTEYLNYSGDDTNTAAFVHFVDIDEDNKFVLIFDEEQGTAANQVQAFNVKTGNRATVTDNTSGAALTYLAATAITSNLKLKAVSYGLTTLVVNQHVTTAVTGSKPTRTVAETMTTMPIPPGDSDEYLQNGEIIYLIDDTIGYPPGFYEVLNGGDNDGSTPYTGVAAAGYGSIHEGPWYERLEAAADGNSLDATTMPVTLTWDGTNFQLNQSTWNKRLGGDAVTNPSPAFIGEKIQDLAVFQDRLWFGAETVVVSSQAGDIFNFWIDNPGNVTDSDPISLPLGGPNANKVQSLVSVQDTLLVFGTSGAQYEIKNNSTGGFSPSSVSLQHTTTYRSYGVSRPIVVGSRLFFTDSRSNYSNVWEYFYDFGSDSNLGVNMAKHVEGYLPTEIRTMATSENDNMLFAVGADEQNVIYVNYFYWDVDEKLQSSWCRWTWPSGKSIYGLFHSQGTLYIVFQKDSRLWLESVPLGLVPVETDGNGDLPFPLTMDRKQSLTGVYSSSTNLTTWTLPFKDTGIDEVVLGEGFSDRAGLRVSVTKDNSGSVTLLTAPGDWSAATAFVGASYEMSATLSQPIVRDQQGQAVPGVFQIKRMEILHTDTTTYAVDITPNQRPTVTREYTASRIGSAVIGQVARDSHGKFTPIVFANAEGTTVTLKNDTPYPCLLTKVEWAGNFVAKRSKIT